MKLTLAVDGMSCQNCANLVKRTLGALPGGPAVEVDLDAKLVRLEGDGPAPEEAALRETIAGIGFVYRGPAEA